MRSFSRSARTTHLPIWGLKNTVVSIISYNYGAGKRERILKTIRICLIATVAITLCGLLIFQLIPDTLLAVFNAQGEVLKIGRVALRIVSFVFPFSGLTLILGAFFQALGNSRKTLLISVVQLVIMLTSAMILSKIGTVYTVWFAFVITEVLVAILAVILMKAVNSKTISSIPSNIVKTDPAAEL